MERRKLWVNGYVTVCSRAINWIEAAHRRGRTKTGTSYLAQEVKNGEEIEGNTTGNKTVNRRARSWLATRRRQGTQQLQREASSRRAGSR